MGNLKSSVVRLNKSSRVYREFYQVSSASRPGVFYVVAQRREGGGWECSCPAWIHHVPRADCKHIVMVRRQLNQAPLPVVKPGDVLPESVQRVLTRFAALDVE
jgi:hypothetical protein